MKLDTRSFIEAAWPRDARNEPGVRRWRAAGRATLALLLGFSAMQYYFFDVQLRILTMPGVVVFAGERTPSQAIKASGAENPRNSGTPASIGVGRTRGVSNSPRAGLTFPSGQV